FYNLTENNSAGLSVNMTSAIVKNQLSMAQGLINLNASEITLGTSSSTPGTLSYTAGWMYGTGKFTRWFDTPSFLIADARGFFPMGSSVYYHPFWFASSAPLTNGGTISISHNPTNSGYTSITQYNDASWGNNVIARSNAAWTILTGNAFNMNPSGIIRFGGNGFIPFVSTDINASLLSGTFGNYIAPSNVTATYFEVNRTGIDYANLNQTWYVGTKNTSNSPLPVDLVFFNGECNNQLVTLHWSTATETNNSFFSVERSDDGNTWTDIANINGAGNSNQVHNYDYTDENFSNETSYYRLKQTDFDGNVKFFSPISVSCTSADDNMQISVYPNPFNEEISLNIDNFPYSKVQIKVFDVIGNMILERNFSEILDQKVNTNIGLKGLSRGVYFIEVMTSDFRKNIKIVKN
ncbi:MAG: T9SS type A sorting domain-containing protein, partial [Bacteroidota bacterium]